MSTSRNPPLRLTRAGALVLMVAAASVLGCTDNPGAQKHTVVHPTAENLSDVQLVHAPPPVAESWLLAATGARKKGRPVSLEVPNAPADRFRSAAFLGDSVVLILDERLNTVRRFNYQGEILDTVGGPGVPLGQLRSPRAVATDGTGGLWVLDRNRTLIKYVRHDGGYVYAFTVDLEHRTDALCGVGDYVVVRGLDEENALLHVYSMTGEVVRSFGDGYRDPVRLVRRQLSRGAIGCDPERTIVVAAYENIPGLRAYSVAGEHLWSSALPGFETIATESEIEPEESVTRSSERPYDEVTGMFALGDGTMLIQVSRNSVRAPRKIDSTPRHYLLDLTTGAVAPLDADGVESVLAVQRPFVLFRCNDGRGSTTLCLRTTD